MALETRLLLVLDPGDAFNVNSSRRSVNEITAMMDRTWKLHLISSRMTRYENLSCTYKVHKAPLISSPDSIVSRTLYLIFSIYKGVEVVRKYDTHAIMCKGGHMSLGLTAYVISRLTRRKCLIRVNEDAILDLMLFIKRLRTPMLSNETFLRIIQNVFRRMESYLLKHADWIVTQGPMDYERIKKIVSKVTFIPLWIDTQNFKRFSKSEISQLKRGLLKSNGDKILLFVGRLHPEKDVETLFYGFEKLLETHEDVTLIVVGTGPEEEKCKKLTEKLNLAEKVRFLGYVNHDELPRYYNIADVYVLTSIWEEWSNTVMEAMACGIPVVATNVGGNPYLVKDEETGFLVPPKNHCMLAQKIAYVLDHLDEARKIALNARESIRKYTRQDIGELYKSVIRGAIDGKVVTALSQRFLNG